MAALFDRLANFFHEPIYPPDAYQLARTYLSGVHYSKKEKKITSHIVRPLPAGVLDPSFDKTNITDPAGLEKAVREAAFKLGPVGGAVSLLLPEACLRVFILTFEGLPSSMAEREEILRWRLNKLVPFKPGDMRLSYDVLRSNGQAKVLLALARTDVVREYESLFGRLGLKIRTVGVPVLNLLSLVRLEPPGHAIIVNIEEDALGLLAVLDGEVSLYRFKPFLQDAQSPMSSDRKMDQVANEIDNTVRFLEDREKKGISSVWVRSAVEGTEDETLAALKERLSPLAFAEFSSPWPLTFRDRQVLSPLIGQVLR
ncbi:MAG: hypothetical protein NTU60_14140 [Candidatus Aminicenantes bacterium]|nr:hypothetical protein [Candidatus Aminicenantes bacterium]